MPAPVESRYADCLPGTWLAERLAVDPLKIDAMRRAGELIAVREPGSDEWLYPAWQFDGLEAAGARSRASSPRRARPASTRPASTRS